MSLWPLTTQQLADICEGELVGDGGLLVRRAVTDTRADEVEESVFFALKGERFDGAEFAENALKAGASAVVVPREHARRFAAWSGVAVIVVKDTLDSLQLLAATARARYRGHLIAITGSNGKTTVKELLRSVMSEQYFVYASPLSWNSQVGVALSLLELPPAADFALIECGISMPGEMRRLQMMVQPDEGIFVNIGDAHIENFSDRAHTAREKSTLFGPRAGMPLRVWVPTDQEVARRAIEDAGGRAMAVDVADEKGVQRVAGVDIDAGRVPHGIRANAWIAAAVAQHHGVAPDAIQRGIRGWTPAPMRLEMMMTNEGIFILNDAYSADPESVDVALQALAKGRTEGRTFAVLGGLAQLGKARRAAEERIGRSIARLKIDRLVVVGDNARGFVIAAREAGYPPENIRLCDDVPNASRLLQDELRSGDRVLVKASRPQRLERIVEALFSTIGPVRAHIDLDAVAENFDRLRRHVGPGVAIMPVVKSFGYGLDAVRLGRIFEQRGAAALCVAYPDEGAQLRQKGIALPILVQNVLPDEAEKIVTWNLAAEVAEPALVRALRSAAQQAGRKVAVHIKVDTGMGRSGRLPEHAIETLRSALEADDVVVEGLMTHLASADETEGIAQTEEQLDRFDRFVEQARALGAEPRWVHAANTAGAVGYERARYNLVRSGIGLFGYADLPEHPAFFVPTLRLTTRVLSVKELPAGAPVGYGGTYVCDGSRRIAVIAVGYNDGYPRALSNRGWVSIRGIRCPVVGRVCMDVTMVDASDVPGTITPGEEVIVYGTTAQEPSLVELAKSADTIAYELLTRISPRVRRIFIGEISGRSAGRA